MLCRINGEAQCVQGPQAARHSFEVSAEWTAGARRRRKLNSVTMPESASIEWAIPPHPTVARICPINHVDGLCRPKMSSTSLAWGRILGSTLMHLRRDVWRSKNGGVALLTHVWRARLLSAAASTHLSMRSPTAGGGARWAGYMGKSGLRLMAPCGSNVKGASPAYTSLQATERPPWHTVSTVKR